MPNWTNFDLMTWEQRRLAKAASKPQPAGTAATLRECELHDLILDHCRRKGWIALHGAMSERTARTIGEWDFVILAAGGRVHLIECKIGKGKLSTEQQALHHWARKLGHEPKIVRSLEEFIEITEP